MCHKVLAPVSLAASAWGNGSLHESSAEWAEMRIISLAHNNLRVSNPLESTVWLREERSKRGCARKEEKSKEWPNQARETEWRWKMKKKRALTAKDLTAYVCLYSNPSVMWFSGILMSPRIILLICQRICLSPDFTSFIVFDLHNVLYACVAINESHSRLHRLSAQFFPIYLQMVIWHTWIGNSTGMPKRHCIMFFFSFPNTASIY